MTKSDLILLIRDYGKRGLFCEIGVGNIDIFVPFYRIRSLKKAAYERVPVGIRINIKPLTMMQHFTVWSILDCHRRAMLGSDPARS